MLYNPERIEPPEPEFAFECDNCGEPIMIGDEYHDANMIGMCRICTDCFDHLRDLLPVRYAGEED